MVAGGVALALLFDEDIELDVVPPPPPPHAVSETTVARIREMLRFTFIECSIAQKEWQALSRPSRSSLKRNYFIESVVLYFGATNLQNNNFTDVFILIMPRFIHLSR